MVWSSQNTGGVILTPQFLLCIHILSNATQYSINEKLLESSLMGIVFIVIYLIMNKKRDRTMTKIRMTIKTYKYNS